MASTHGAELFLDLDPNVKDPFGFPVTRITAEFKVIEKKIAAFMQDKMEQCRW